MGQALYRDYRPKNFDEVVGQQHITSTLKRAISGGRIRHAYLFTGPKGVGKTSVARILAHEVNELPYSDDSINLDIIEIDAASNRRIDEIRDLRDKVHITPTSAKYKVYIIDEVHMLTREAFNALLKTLEEPPAHCIFILATTEAHKLPETIVSRTQRFEFKPIDPSSASTHLGLIAKNEKIDIDKPALELLAEHGEGSFRDSISLLDQLSTVSKKISEKEVREFLGLPEKQQIDSLVAAISKGDIAQCLEVYDQIKETGSNAASIAKLLSKSLREMFISQPSQVWIAGLLRDLIEVPASSRPEELLEIAMLGVTASNVSLSEVVAEPGRQEEPKAEAVAEAPALETKKEIKAESKPKKPLAFNETAWEEILNEVKNEAASLYTALRLAEPKMDGETLSLTFQFPLHQKKLSVADNKELVAKIVQRIVGHKIVIEAKVGAPKAEEEVKDPPKPKKKISDGKDPELKTISNIFGPPEVLES